MNREILFKAKRTDNGEWVEGYFVKGKWYLDEKKKCAILPLDLCFYPCCEINEWIEIDPKTVCQYTGLTDKNGKKIFEGDICKTKFFGKDDGKGRNYSDYDVFKVSYEEGTFFLENNRRQFSATYIPDMAGDGIEVIGNIFDNPELLN